MQEFIKIESFGKYALLHSRNNYHGGEGITLRNSNE